MKKAGRIFFAIAVVVFIVWSMLYQSGTIGGGDKVQPGEAAASEAVVEGQWSELAETEIPLFYSAVGTVRSREEIEMISRLPTARVVRVHFNNGESFKEGDVLIQLESRDLQARVDVVRENLKEAESRLAFARKEQERYTKLFEKEVATLQAYEEVISNTKVAEAQVAAMKHELENALTNLEYATIKAPFDGIVSERNCDPGDLATPQNMLMKIFNPAKLQLRVPIRENLFSQIRIGDKLPVSVGSTGKDWQAEIREIIPSVDPGSRMFLVDADFEGDTRELMPGMFASCLVPLGKRKALTVPTQAIRNEGQLEYMRFRSETGTERDVPVKTAALPDQARREVLSGAQAGMFYRENVQ